MIERQGPPILGCIGRFRRFYIIYNGLLPAPPPRSGAAAVLPQHNFWSCTLPFSSGALAFLAKSTRQLVSRVPGPGGPTHGRWLRRSA
eukprot:925291-Pyramimonas_sp.AAC.2